MKLKEIVWNDSSKKAFLDYLVTHGNYEKQAWTRKILNTQLDVLAVPTKTMHTMASEIYRGDYAAFLSLKLYDCYECIALNGMIISKIKDFDEMVGYLKEYTKVMENWAHCDLLTFTIAAENEARFRELAVEFIQSTRVFERRLGLFIHLHLIRNPTYVEVAFDVLITLEDEEAYYCNYDGRLASIRMYYSLSRSVVKKVECLVY